MVFSSNIFLFLFLPLALVAYFLFPEKLVGKKYKNYLLLIISLFFYAWGEIHYLWLLMLSIIGNYAFGRAIEKALISSFYSEAKPQNFVIEEAKPHLFFNSEAKPHLFFNSEAKPKNLGLRVRSLFYEILRFAQDNKKSAHYDKKSVWDNKNPHNKKTLPNIIIVLAVTFNLALLGYFKYANFIIENFNLLFGLEIANEKIQLPIGISFFTFHAISYLVDIYRRKCAAQKNILDLALYISFFPQLIAGPIVRYNFVEKYLTRRRHSSFFISYGIRRFVIGFAKKVLIANPLGEFADLVFTSSNSDLNSPFAWLGIICYTLQIYFDFSGYSDMAVGLARIFGFKFPENFNYPYISKSIKEFWRRWHMSLSAWFRDYVYIPLGGNRVSKSKQYFNLVLVFFLCGLWHGASWNFIIWGLFHGFFLVLERLLEGRNFSVILRRSPIFLSLRRRSPIFSVILRRSRRISGQEFGACFMRSFASLRMTKKVLRITKKMLKMTFCHFYAMLVVMIGWVFFRSPDLNYALNFLQTMFGGFFEANVSSDLSRLIRSHFFWTAFIAGILGFSPLIKNLALKLIRKNKIFVLFFDLFLLLVFIITIIQLSAATHNPFIYFQF